MQSTSDPALNAARLSDETLCEAALRGDTQAWSALVERHNHRVLLTLIANGVRADVARDLAQEVWLRLFEQQQRGALAVLQLPGLAITQAKFLAATHTRQKGAAVVGLPAAEDFAIAISDPMPSAEARVLGSEQLRRAAQELERCHPTAQRVFQAVYEDPDRPHTEVARELGVSLQRVRQILCEVRKRLRMVLEGGSHE